MSICVARYGQEVITHTVFTCFSPLQGVALASFPDEGTEICRAGFVFRLERRRDTIDLTDLFFVLIIFSEEMIGNIWLCTT